MIFVEVKIIVDKILNKTNGKIKICKLCKVVYFKFSTYYNNIANNIIKENAILTEKCNSP